MPDIKKITEEEANNVIETKEPRGLFYTIEHSETRKLYVGIDNTKGDAWVEDFKSLSSCKNWLLNG